MNLHNFESLQVRVGCAWNLDLFNSLLRNYEDKELISFLKFGWPISHDGKSGSTKVPVNWPGARKNIEEVKQYFALELSNNAVLGPFQPNPFSHKAYLSPLNTRDKKKVMKKESSWTCLSLEGTV